MSDDDYVQVSGEEGSNATGYEDEEVGEEEVEDDEEEDDAEDEEEDEGDEHDLYIADVEIDDENLELPVFTEEGMLALKRGYFIGSQQSLLSKLSINSTSTSPISFLAYEHEFGLTVVLKNSANPHVYRTQDVEDAVYPVGMELLKSTPVDQKDSAIEPKPFIVLQIPKQEPFINAEICHTRVACLARSKTLYLFDLHSSRESTEGVISCPSIATIDGVERFVLGKESILYVKASEPKKLYSRPLSNLASNEKVVYTEPAGRISAFALSQDGLYALIITEAPTMVVVLLADGKSQVLMDLQETCDAVYWPKKDTIVVAESSGSIVVYSATEGESGLIDGEIERGWRLYDPCDTPRPLPSWHCTWFFDYFEPWDAFVMSNSHSSKASVIGKWTEEGVDEETGEEYSDFGWYAYSIAYNAAGETTKRLEMIDDRRLFSLADRPITFLGDLNEVDDRVYVCGIKWMTSSTKSIPPAFVLGTNRELEGVPDFAPAPTLLIQSSTGLVHATALVDLNNKARHLLSFDPIKELHFHPAGTAQVQTVRPVQQQPSSIPIPAVPASQPTALFGQPATTTGLFSQVASTSSTSQVGGLFGQPPVISAEAPPTTPFGQVSTASAGASTGGLFGQATPASGSTGLFGQNLLSQQPTTTSGDSTGQPAAGAQGQRLAPQPQAQPSISLGMTPAVTPSTTGQSASRVQPEANQGSASQPKALFSFGTSATTPSAPQPTPGLNIPPVSERKPAVQQGLQPHSASTGGQQAWWPLLEKITADSEKLKEERRVLEEARKRFEQEQNALKAYQQAQRASSDMPNWRTKLSESTGPRSSKITTPPQRKAADSGAPEKALLRFVEELDADMMSRSHSLGTFFKDEPELESFFAERKFDSMLTEANTSLSETARLKATMEELNRLLDDLDDKNVYTMCTTESAKLMSQRRNGGDALGQSNSDSVASAETSADRALTQRLQGLIQREEQVLRKYQMMESFFRTELETLEDIHREQWMRFRVEERNRFEEDVLNRVKVLCTKAKTAESRIEMLIRRASRRTGLRDLARSISSTGKEKPAIRTSSKKASKKEETKFRTDFSSFAECDRTTPIQVETLNTGFHQQLNKDFGSIKQEDDIRQQFNSTLSERINRTKQKLKEAREKNIITPAKPAGPALSRPSMHSAGSLRMPPDASTFRSFGQQQQQPGAGGDSSQKKKPGDEQEGASLKDIAGSKPAAGGLFGAGAAGSGETAPPPPPPPASSEKPGGFSMAGFGSGLQQQQQQQTPSTTAAMTPFGGAGGATATTPAQSAFGGGEASGDASKVIKEAVKAFYSVVKPDKANDHEVEGLYNKYKENLVTTLQTKYRTSTDPRVQEALAKLVQSTKSVAGAPGLLGGVTSPPRPSGFGSGFAGTAPKTPGIFGGGTTPAAGGGGFASAAATTPGPAFGGSGFGGAASTPGPALGATGFGGIGAAATPSTSTTGGWGATAPSSISGGFTSSAHERALRAFYEKANPTKVNDVPATLTKYKGREMAMWETLKQKYSNFATFIDQLLREAGITGGSATPGAGFGGGGGFASALAGGGTPAFGGASPSGFGASGVSGGGFGASGFGGNPSASPVAGGFQGGFGQSSFGTPGGTSGGFGAAAATGSGNVFGSAGGSGFGALAGGNVFGGDAGAFGGSGSAFGGGGNAFGGGPTGGFGGTPGGGSFSRMRG